MKKIRKWSIFLLVAMALLAVVICGSDDEGPTSSSVTVTLTSSNLTEDGYQNGKLMFNCTTEGLENSVAQVS